MCCVLIYSKGVAMEFGQCTVIFGKLCDEEAGQCTAIANLMQEFGDEAGWHGVL